MPLPWQSGSTSGASNKSDDDRPSVVFTWSSPDRTPKPVSWNDSLNVEHFRDPSTWVAAFVATTALFGGIKFYRVYLRRIPSVEYIHPDKYRRRTIFGKVTSVGDGDGFHLYHTPGGHWAGWGWLRRVPTQKKALKGQTISIRIAGIDAPEMAHFGRPAQPNSAEALAWLQTRLLNGSVRAHIFKRDQYERVVASVYTRRLLFFRTDVGLEMLKLGLATTYEAKSGVEFGGVAKEAAYRAAQAEAQEKKLGMWGGRGGRAAKNPSWFGLGGTTKPPATKTPKTPFETPREFKARMKDLEKGATK